LPLTAKRFGNEPKNRQWNVPRTENVPFPKKQEMFPHFLLLWEGGEEIIIFGFLDISYEEAVLSYIFSSNTFNRLKHNAAAFKAKTTRQAPNGHYLSSR